MTCELDEIKNKKREESDSYNPVCHGGMDGRISILAFDKHVFPSENNKSKEILSLEESMVDHHVYVSCSLRTYFSLSNSHNGNEKSRLKELTYDNRRIEEFSLETLKKSLIQYIERKEIIVLSVSDKYINWEKAKECEAIQIIAYNRNVAVHCQNYKAKSEGDDKIVVKKSMKELAKAHTGDNLYRAIGKAFSETYLYYLDKRTDPKLVNNDRYADCNAHKYTKCEIKLNSSGLKNLLQSSIVADYADYSVNIFDGERMEPQVTTLFTNSTKNLLIIGLKGTRCEVIKQIRKGTGRHNNKGRAVQYDFGQYFVLNLDNGNYYQKCFHTKCAEKITKNVQKDGGAVRETTASRKGMNFVIKKDVLDEIKKQYSIATK